MKTRVETISTDGTNIRLINTGSQQTDLISLTDIAKYKNSDEPGEVIRNWMRSHSTIEYLGLWEQLHNEAFNNEAYTNLLIEAGSNAFTLTPQKWAKVTAAIGIASRPGRYGGTYAVTDIAFEFAAWVSPEFRLYLIKDYQQLKQQENSPENLEWNVRRLLSKTNYKIHTDAIREKLIPQELTKAQAAYTYASEADRLNVALFGLTAGEWRQLHPKAKGNIRDNASLEQLTVLSNLESMNAELIKDGESNTQRTLKLNRMAREQLHVLTENISEQHKIEKQQ